MAGKIHPFVLSGGSGSRLWPLSQANLPKQFVPLAGPRSLLQETLSRLADRERFMAPTIIAAAAHRRLLLDQLATAGIDDAQLILEPTPRNTACAVAVAALAAMRRDPEALILVLPSDHAITGQAGFLATVDQGARAARVGQLVLFGVAPHAPATGYGYMRVRPADIGAVHTVDAFIEKPDLATAAAYVASGDYLWNSGVFLLSARAALAELDRWAPAVLEAAEAACDQGVRTPGQLDLDNAALDACPSISFDRAVMERTDRAAVVPAAFGWADVGSWSALWDLGPQDEAGNVALGRVLAVASTGSYLRSDGPLIAAVGVEDLVVVAHQGAVLVTRRGADQAVGAVADRLREAVA